MYFSYLFKFLLNINYIAPVMLQSSPQRASSLLSTDQALIPERYKKNLQSRALLDHYQQAQMRKLYNERQSLNQKIQEMQFNKMQNEKHLREMQRRQLVNQYKKNQYSKEYQEMIEMRKERQKFERQQELQYEKQILHQEKWLRDVSQQKQIDKLKKLEYGKQLEKHLKIQEEKRIAQANRIRQMREQLSKEDNVLKDPTNPYIRKTYQHRPRPGVKDALSWSLPTNKMNTQHYEQQGQQLQQNQSAPITPRMDHMLKVQHQKYFNKGLQVQEYKSQNQKKYFQKQNPEYLKVRNDQYNPITNPIPYKYRNSNVLKLLSDYS